MDNHLGVRVRRAQRGLNLVGHFMGLIEVHLPVHLDMDLDERPAARGAGAQIVHGDHLRVRDHDLPDTGPLALGQLAVHKHVERAARDLPGDHQDVACDRDAEQGVGIHPTEFRGQQQGDDHRRVDQNIADVVHGIGLDRDRAGLAHHVGLKTG